MMNGYSFQDILGRPGSSLPVTVNGKRKVFYGTAAQPASLFINKKEGKLSTVINAGDCIDFIPAVPGIPAQACLGDIEGASECLEITLNGVFMPLETPLKIGDVIRIRMPKKEEPEKEEIEREEAEKEEPKIEESEIEESGIEEPEETGFGAHMQESGLPGEDSVLSADPKEVPGSDGMEPIGTAAEEAGQNISGTDSMEKDTPPEMPDRAVQTAKDMEGLRTFSETEGGTRHMQVADAVVDIRSRVISNTVKKDGNEADGQLELDFGMDMDKIPRPQPVREPELRKAQPVREPEMREAQPRPEPPTRPAPQPGGGSILFKLNGSPLRLPRKENGASYYLMDLLKYSGINLNNPQGTIELEVNGEPGMFQQKLREGDVIVIEEKKL